MNRRYDDRWRRFAPSEPIPVDGGLVASSRRGAMAERWWSQRFIDVLESYGLGGRMQRGRRYARAGQVIDLEVEPGFMVAQVQGSRVKPYLVTVRLREVTDAQWSAIESELRSRVGLIAALVAGEVSDELELAFGAAGVDLFPSSWRDLRASCNCPDGASPCKHLAAVLYLFADRLDRDPWLLLRWRGRDRTEIMELLSPRSAPVVAPWWPFAPGEIPDITLAGAATPAADGLAGLGYDAGARRGVGASADDDADGDPGYHADASPVDDANADDDVDVEWGNGLPLSLGPLDVDIRGVPVADYLQAAYNAFGRTG